MDKKTDKKRKPPIPYRLPSGMEEEFEERVARSGLSRNGYITDRLFGEEAPRASRKPTVDEKQVTQVMSMVAWLRDDLRGIAKLTGNIDAIVAKLEQANANLVVIRAACVALLGRKKS